MDDEHDYQYDDMISSLYSDFAQDVLAGRDDLYGEIVTQFTMDRLQSYYIQNPQVAVRARWALDQARSLLPDHPEASLVFAAAAVEVGLKSGLLKPILHGLVHDEGMAAIIADLIPQQRNRQFRELLFGILTNYGGVDITAHKRDGINKTLWEEMSEVQERRNRVAHRAESVDVAEATLAVEIGGIIVETLFPAVIGNLGLKTDDNLLVSS